VFAKLNLKHQREILVVDPPSSFEPVLLALEDVVVRRDPAQLARVSFALAFVTTQAGLDALSAQLAVREQGDAVLWFAYPKASSGAIAASSTAIPAGT
jgi:hypothetical protein